MVEPGSACVAEEEGESEHRVCVCVCVCVRVSNAHRWVGGAGERATWLERERAKEKANKTARQDSEKEREKKTCGFCNVSVCACVRACACV